MKKGISLIVLVITIIVMIILAASVVITLSNTGIINRASEAVDLSNERQVQDLAALIWSDAFMDRKRGSALETEVTTKLSEQGVTSDKWNITVTDTGVSVKNKNNLTLGELITSAADYGKTVDYEANGVTDWKVFYHTNEYVYLIASEKLEYDKVPTTIPEATIAKVSLTIDNETKDVGNICWEENHGPTTTGTIQNPTLWMANWSNYSTNPNGRCVSYFLDETYWSVFKNATENYKSYVVGAIGTPTAEMFVASWNSKREAIGNEEIYNVELNLTTQTGGYAVNGTHEIEITSTDDLYIWNNEYNAAIWLASPHRESHLTCYVGFDHVGGTNAYFTAYGIRPVVCLKASIPATVGTTTDFSLVK